MQSDRARILIVDDDQDIRTNIKDILDDLGYQTETAHDGPTALDLVGENSYDVVLFDYKMPGMDGATLYREIKKIRPETAAIMITAYAGSNGAAETLDAGAWQVVSKPVNIPELLGMLESAIRAPIVLIVDDDQDFCQTLWQLLRDRHYRVSIAHSEYEGVRKASEASYDVAIIDLRLKPGDGRKVLERIREVNPKAKKVMITGHHADADQLLADLGLLCADAVFMKPLEMEKLLTAIKPSESDE